MTEGLPLQLIACAPLYVDSFEGDRFSWSGVRWEAAKPRFNASCFGLRRYRPWLNLIR